MNKKFYLISLLLLASCTSFKPDYVVTEATETSVPDWILQKNADESDTKQNRPLYRYYVNNAENTNRRLCLKSAETRAKQKIAAEIAEEITENYREQLSQDQDETVSKIRSELEQSIKVSLHGVSVQDQYVEKRSYKKELGADKDYKAYKCDVVVRIKKSDLIEAIQTYKNRTIQKSSKENKALAEALDKTMADIQQ